MKDIQDVLIELEEKEDQLTEMESDIETLEEIVEELNIIQGMESIADDIQEDIKERLFDRDNLKVEIAELEEEGREIANKL